MRVAIYARKSKEDQGHSVERQLHECRAYAKRKAWIVLEEHIYVDQSISGGEFQRRAGLQRLLSAAAQRPRSFDAVVMMEPERLGRDMFRGPITARDLSDFGVRIFYYLTDEEERAGTPEDRLLMAIRGYRGESERDRSKLRTRDALACHFS
jgi:DNA invertase Pin-like site-specific DNA recombinase